MKVSKLFLSSLISFVMFIGISLSAHAALVTQEPVAGEFVVLDTDTNLMWLMDANYASTTGYDEDGYMDFDTAFTWADTLTYAGYNDWRLPTADANCGEIYGCDTAEMGHLFYLEKVTSLDSKNFTNLQPYLYWTTTDHTIFNNAVYDLNFETGYQGAALTTTGNAYAMAVRVVPEPISTTLFIVGGVTLGFRRFRRTRK